MLIARSPLDFFLLIHPFHSAITLDRSSRLHSVSDVSKFLQIGHHRCVRMQNSIGERRLWVRSYFTSSV